MRAGLLTEKISVHRPVIVKSGTGATNTVYEECLRMRAYVQYQNGNRQEENGEIVFNRTVTFQIRRFYDFDETHRIHWNNRYYRIISIEPRRSEQLISIVAERVEE